MTHQDQRGSGSDAATAQRLAAFLLVAAMLPAVVASWSAGPIARVQTALVEASRAPGAIESRPAAHIERDHEASVAPAETAASTAPLHTRLCEALRDRLDLCATPPPALV